MCHCVTDNIITNKNKEKWGDRSSFQSVIMRHLRHQFSPCRSDRVTHWIFGRAFAPYRFSRHCVFLRPHEKSHRVSGGFAKLSHKSSNSQNSSAASGDPASSNWLRRVMPTLIRSCLVRSLVTPICSRSLPNFRLEQTCSPCSSQYIRKFW